MGLGKLPCSFPDLKTFSKVFDIYIIHLSISTFFNKTKMGKCGDILIVLLLHSLCWMCVSCAEQRVGRREENPRDKFNGKELKRMTIDHVSAFGEISIVNIFFCVSSSVLRCTHLHFVDFLGILKLKASLTKKGDYSHEISSTWLPKHVLDKDARSHANAEGGESSRGPNTEQRTTDKGKCRS
ncbi:hypothetical protein STEG23_008166 [Scotinomys teguina]